MFRRRRKFVQSDRWYIHGIISDTFRMIIFDLINSIFKYWFWFKICCFKAVTGTNRIKSLFKGCDSWCIRGSGGNNFQMIIFDLINSLFKCWFRFELCYFRSDFYTKTLKILGKKVVADIFMVAEAILFRWFYLIPLIILLNVGQGSIMLLQFYCSY